MTQQLSIPSAGQISERSHRGLLDVARKAYEEATTLPEFADLAKKAEVIRVAARAAGLSTQAQNEWTRYKIDCEIRADEAIGAMRSAGELKRHGQKRQDTRSPGLGDLGVKHQRAVEWHKLGQIPEQERESAFAKAQEEGAVFSESVLMRIFSRQAKEAKREARRQENAQLATTVSDPMEIGARFATILLDPPWDWGDEGDGDQFGRAKPDYSTIPREDLANLPIERLSDTDCHLYLWITNRSLPKGFALLEGWGFRYVTMLTWPKPSFGMGNYFRGQTEQVLFGVTGSQLLKRKDASTLLPPWRRGPDGHSSKPPEFHAFVESCSPGPYLELFARGPQLPGWTRWGADVA